MSPSETVPPTEKPAISGRDVSYHETQAGIAARDAAADSGGDPAQIRALVGAAAAEDGPKVRMITVGSPMLKKLPLRGDDLLVALCLMLYSKVFGADPRQQLALSTDEEGIQRYQAIAALALIYTQPDTAYDLLDHAADADISKEDAAGWARDFRREALSFAGDFGPREVEIIGNHVIALARRQSAAEDTPGK